MRGLLLGLPVFRMIYHSPLSRFATKNPIQITFSSTYSYIFHPAHFSHPTKIAHLDTISHVYIYIISVKSHENPIEHPFFPLNFPRDDPRRDGALGLP